MSKQPKEKKKRGIGRVTIPIICVLLAILIVGNAACMYYSRLLDVYVGMG